MGGFASNSETKVNLHPFSLLVLLWNLQTNLPSHMLTSIFLCSLCLWDSLLKIYITLKVYKNHGLCYICWCCCRKQEKQEEDHSRIRSVCSAAPCSCSLWSSSSTQRCCSQDYHRSIDMSKESDSVGSWGHRYIEEMKQSSSSFSWKHIQKIRLKISGCSAISELRKALEEYLSLLTLLIKKSPGLQNLS